MDTNKVAREYANLPVVLKLGGFFAHLNITPGKLWQLSKEDSSYRIIMELNNPIKLNLRPHEFFSIGIEVPWGLVGFRSVSQMLAYLNVSVARTREMMLDTIDTEISGWGLGIGVGKRWWWRRIYVSMRGDIGFMSWDLSENKNSAFGYWSSTSFGFFGRPGVEYYLTRNIQLGVDCTLFYGISSRLNPLEKEEDDSFFSSGSDVVRGSDVVIKAGYPALRVFLSYDIPMSFLAWVSSLKNIPDWR